MEWNHGGGEWRHEQVGMSGLEEKKTFILSFVKSHQMLRVMKWMMQYCDIY